MILLNRDDIFRLYSATELIDAVEQAVLDVEAGAAVVPPRLQLALGENTFLVMPATTDRVYGAKLVSVFPGNAACGRAAVVGAMVLNDAENGECLAILDGAALTAVRTAAVGASAVRRLTPGDVSSVGIIGCGVLGAWLAVFMREVRPVSTVFCVARSEASFLQFRDTVARHAPQLALVRCVDATELLRRTSVVIAATTSTSPVVPDDVEALRGRHFFGFGSFQPTVQEFPTNVYALAGFVFVDTGNAQAEAGDLVVPLRDGRIRPEQIMSLGSVIAGRQSVDVSGTTAFKSVGSAVYDLAAARALHVRALERGAGVRAEFG